MFKKAMPETEKAGRTKNRGKAPVDNLCNTSSVLKMLYIHILFLLVIIPIAFTTFKRNKLWQDELLLWEDVVRESPKKARGYTALGMAYFDKGEFDEAVTRHLTALKLKPDLVDARINLGNAYSKQGRFDDALQEYKTALQLNPEYVEAHNNLGNLYLSQGKLKEAEEEYLEAVRLKS